MFALLQIISVIARSIIPVIEDMFKLVESGYSGLNYSYTSFTQKFSRSSLVYIYWRFPLRDWLLLVFFFLDRSAF